MIESPKAQIEAMVTAVIAADPQAQASIASDLTAGEEAYCRAAAEIIAGIFGGLGKGARVSPADLWAEQMRYVSQGRIGDGR
jgi:hypothetical protein